MTVIMKHDATGRSTGRMKTGKFSKIDYQFAPIPTEMLASPAWIALSPNGRRVVDRLIVENGRHGGKENGRLPCTYADFIGAGIRDGSVSDAIREAVALGFVKVVERGRAGNGEFRRAALYELTFLFKLGRRPSNEWASIETTGDAARVSAEARTKRARRSAQTKLSRIPEKSEHHGHGCPRHHGHGCP